VNYQRDCHTKQINNRRAASRYSKGETVLVKGSPTITHSFEHYSTLMAQDGTYITDNELFTFTQLYGIDIKCFNSDTGSANHYKYYSEDYDQRKKQNRQYVERNGKVARTGHLEILKYAHENGCAWDSTTCEAAEMCGNVDILKYVQEKGCECESKDRIAIRISKHGLGNQR